MKLLLRIAALACVALGFSLPAKAQYYQIANQLSGLISPAIQGGFNYKGYVELSGTAGVGTNRANFIGISTTQGFRYASWFYMGAGIGVDVAMSQLDGESPQPGSADTPWGYYRTSKTKAMIPVFTDFRFNLGEDSSTSMFIDLKLGAAWLIGSNYLRMNSGYMTSDAQFFVKPTVGVRVPVNPKNPRQAFNIGLTYQLLTSNGEYYWRNGSISLNNFGVTIGYEW